MSERVPSQFIDHLASVIYTQENVERGSSYLRGRGINPDLLPYPWTATGSDLTPFSQYRSWYPLHIFSDSLYIPITDMRDPTSRTLAGFDVRYIGEDASRIRYHKFKRDSTTHLFYNLPAALTSSYIIVTEGAIDAQTFIQLGYTAISPLTALATLRFAQLLYALVPKIYLSYDNNPDGVKAMSKILKLVSPYPVVANSFQVLTYKGKDPNEGLMLFGPDYMSLLLSQQIGPPHR